MKNECKFEQWTVREISSSWSKLGSKKRFIDLPQYQRSIVWRVDQKQEFIKSLKNGFPVGSILLYRKGGSSESERFFLIDGLQRLSTIKKYLDNPCDFFDTYDLDTKNINIIKSCLYFENNQENNERFLELVKNWMRGLDGLDGKYGYGGYYLCDYLLKELKNELEFKLIDRDKLIKNLDALLSKIKEEACIDDAMIPVTIYSGAEDNLPNIFEIINSKGTKLNRYEIYSASWAQYGSMKIENKNIADLIKRKYDRVLDEGWEVDNYDGSITDCTYFEYIFGLGKLISEKYINLFDNSDQSDKADSCGFNLLAACLVGGIRKENLEKLPVIIKKYYEDGKLLILETNILKTIKKIEDKLNPFITIKTSRRKSESVVIKIAHSESHIITLISKLFKLTYKDNGLDENNDVKHTERINKFVSNLEFHYLFDIITDQWRGSGDSRLSELLKDGSIYEEKIDKYKWDSALDAFFDKQLYKKEKKRANIKYSETLLLNYIYSKFLSIHELGNKNFHLDHIISVNELSRLVEQENLDGLPIGHIANICLLSDDVNNRKGKKAVINFYDEAVANKDTAIINELDKQLLLKQETQDIMYLTKSPITKDQYYNFLSRRFSIIKQLFYKEFGIS